MIRRTATAAALALILLPSVAHAVAPPREPAAPRGGALPLDAERYARAKAAADARTPAARSQREPLEEAPVTGGGWNGQFDTGVAPGDPTGAIGPTRYVQLVNLRFGIYDRTGRLLAAGGLEALAGHSRSALTDPQVMWDPDTGRFYFLALNHQTNTFAWGFSKTPSPSAAGDFCRYTADLGYGSRLPDFPKLGDTKDFLLVGSNVFRRVTGGYHFVGADVAWWTKPPAGTTCPASSSFRQGRRGQLTNVDGSQMATPVPAEQVDGSSTGWVVGTPDLTAVPNADEVTIYRVVKDSTGAARISLHGAVEVPTYSMPANASQPGTAKKLDTMDGRFTRALAAMDPGRGKLAVWTAHAVFGGAGAEERWYEIAPAELSLLQMGKATSQSLFAFNGTVSSDRAVAGTQKRFGASMVMSFNTSSSAAYPAIQMVSKVGTGTQSGFVMVKQSPGPNVDFSCSYPYGPPCRWGDYSGAAPDPTPPAGAARGRVWLTNMWNVASRSTSDVDWRTWIWSATP